MQVETFGRGDDLLWVMGWGNRADSRHERWFIDRLVEAGYRVHALALPTNGTDFERDYLSPVRAYDASLTDHRLVGHSMGGLVVAHLQPDVHAVYLSPWWGVSGIPRLLSPLLYLPVSRPVVPIDVEPEALGGLATDSDVTAPDRISPRWLRAMKRAQQTLPPVDESAVVFYTPDDTVVDPAAIESHTPDQLERYDGGHELFSSTGRDGHVDRVVAALESGSESDSKPDSE